ncbi:MAG: long-chain fatty acid--CoA ligase [Clostridia bacterium]|nr:long-chain fatty acid--CoA ligase [Clostridia bacterium]
MYKYSPLTFGSILPEVVSKYSQMPALGYVGETPLTYHDLGQHLNALMAFLEEIHIVPGNKVAILSQNMPNWGITFFALQRMGIVAVPLLPDFSTHEISNIIRHADLEAIFVSESLQYKIDALENPFVGKVILLDDFDLINNDNKTVFDINKKPIENYFPTEDELSILLYTSGTTGEPKGVMLSQKNVITNAIQSNAVQPILPGDKFLSVLPLSHTYENTIGLVLPIMKGANVSYLRKPPTASVLVPAMQAVRPDIMLTVPMIIEKVYKTSIFPEIQKKATTRLLTRFAPTRRLIHRLAGRKLMKKFGGRLKFFGIGGAKLDATVEQFLREAHFPYAIGYGLTETAPLLAGSNPQNTRLQAIGPAVVDCELKIANPNPRTGEGEIWAKGANVMLGYYKNPERTSEVFSENGWFKTGDLGVFDSDGYLSHKGRLKNMIVGANGENIYPEEIETLINNFRHVLESLVVEQKGKLVAMVHYNREELELKMKEMKADISQKVDEKIEEITARADKAVEELTRELHQYINSRVNKISRIHLMVEHRDPFQKTATQKIKRYLYG